MSETAAEAEPTATGETPTAAAEPARKKEHVVLELVSSTDPITRRGYEERDPIIRLRHVLRISCGTSASAVSRSRWAILPTSVRSARPTSTASAVVRSVRTGCACAGGGPGRS